MLAHLAELSGILELQLQMPENGTRIVEPNSFLVFPLFNHEIRVILLRIFKRLIRFISLFRAGCLNKFLRIPEILPLAHGLLSFLHE